MVLKLRGNSREFLDTRLARLTLSPGENQRIEQGTSLRKTLHSGWHDRRTLSTLIVQKDERFQILHGLGIAIECLGQILNRLLGGSLVHHIPLGIKAIMADGEESYRRP
jgi:hypothetical protein